MVEHLTSWHVCQKQKNRLKLTIGDKTVTGEGFGGSNSP